MIRKWARRVDDLLCLYGGLPIDFQSESLASVNGRYRAPEQPAAAQELFSVA